MRTSISKRQIVALMAAGALSLGMLVGCGGSTGGSGATDDTGDEQQQTAPADEPEAGADEGTDTTDVETPATSADTAAEGVVDTGEFSFELPAYWQGRVETDVVTLDAVGETQSPRVARVYLPGNPDALLAELSLHTDGEEPMVAGDIGNHLVGYASAHGTHVEVWAINWPWLAAQGGAGSEVSEDELRELVDLSTGGAQSYDDAVAAGVDGVGMKEYEFTSTIAESITIK